MPILHLTNSCVETASAHDKTYSILDSELKGFGLRITPAGKKNWLIQVMANTKRHYKTIGTWPEMPTSKARKTDRASCYKPSITDVL